MMGVDVVLTLARRPELLVKTCNCQLLQSPRTGRAMVAGREVAASVATASARRNDDRLNVKPVLTAWNIR